ncbi:MAG: hypothetical protein HY804_03805 [Nitrospinae bacterium]|nr:hypothetical protein [Nitrospinota bacterium]
MTDFVSTHFIEIIAFLAFFQPWIITLYKKYFINPKITFVPFGFIEISFSTFGPTITINGTLNVDARSVYVHRVELKVTRKIDKSQYHFQGLFDRKETLKLSHPLNAPSVPTRELISEPAYSFQIDPQKPKTLNMLFTASEITAELREKLLVFQQKWNNEYSNPLFAEFHTRNIDLSDKQAAKVAVAALEGSFSEFIKSEIAQSIKKNLDQREFWISGDYHLEIYLSTSIGLRKISSHAFTLTEGDTKKLQFNAFSAMRDICNLNSSYGFAYVQYNLPKSP